MTINTYLFDAEGRDRTVPLNSAVIEAIDDRQLLWVEVSGGAGDAADFDRAARLLHVPPAIVARLRNADGALRLGHQRPRVDLYTDCFHLNIQAVQERESSSVPQAAGSREEVPPPARPPIPWTVFRVVDVHFIVFANVVLTVHGDSVAFLESFDHRIKGDTNLGTLNGPAFLGAVLNWHINGFFRALETIEKEVEWDPLESTCRHASLSIL